jgi:hypothetical protein
MNFEQRAEERNAIITEHQNRVINSHAWRCCLNCANWFGEQCAMYKAMPPPHIIVNGCKDHDIDIPF